MLCVVFGSRSASFFTLRILWSTRPSVWRSDPNARAVILRRRAAETESDQQDWRAFRAQLVKQAAPDESNASSASIIQNGWAHATPLIEQGSVLLGSPGNQFALHYQSFHKAVILIVHHDAEGSAGIILNRLTAFAIDDAEFDGEDAAAPIPVPRVGPDSWLVWFGGGPGLKARSREGGLPLFCLHDSRGLAKQSTEIIPGLFLIEFVEAWRAVQAGQAKRGDFLVFSGHTGWTGGQLQHELDRDGSWTMAAVDARTLTRSLRAKQSIVSQRLRDMRTEHGTAEGSVTLSLMDIGDGTQEWQELYTSLGQGYQDRMDEFVASGEMLHTDAILGRWIQFRLLPDFQIGSEAPSDTDVKRSPLATGTLLKGSSTAWLLGVPGENKSFEKWSYQPAQYLHKAVLLLLEDEDDGHPTSLLLLNGPHLGEQDTGGSVFFGGPDGFHENTLFQFDTWAALGQVVVPPAALETLMQLGALEVVQNMKLADILSVEREDRWMATRQTTSADPDPALVALGDKQRSHWYQRFLNVRIDADET